MFLPLPIDYATQVPLYVELTVDPPNVVDKIEYVAEEEHDWGAVITLAKDASASSLKIKWMSVTLVRGVPHDSIGSVYTKLGDPSQWLAPSAIAQSDYAPLAATARGLVSGGDSAETKMSSIIKWTSTNLSGVGDLTGLDAKTVQQLYTHLGALRVQLVRNDTSPEEKTR